jgi:8-oxo-dGTP diphosphatase
MRAIPGSVREPMYDIKAVKWLSLKQAIEMLTRAHEKAFLAHVGPIALKAARFARISARPRWYSLIKPKNTSNARRRYG